MSTSPSPRAPRPRLGELLLQRGWVRRDQIDQAAALQRRAAGRFGTCLLEIGAVDEERLLRALSDQLQAPAAQALALHNLPENTVAELSPQLARRCRAVPMGLGQNCLEIATLDVENLDHQDELTFATGRRIRLFVASEARIYEALERYYQEECPDRFSLLLDQLNRSCFLWGDTGLTADRQSPNVSGAANDPWASLPDRKTTAAPAMPSLKAHRPTPIRLVGKERKSPPPPVPPAPPESVFSGRRSSGIFDLLSEAESHPPELQGRLAPVVRLEPKRRDSPEATAPSIPLSAEERSLLAPFEGLSSLPERPQPSVAETRDRIARNVLAQLTPDFDRVALLKADREGVVGWMAQGPGLDRHALGQFRASFQEPSAFVGLARGVRFHRGPLADVNAHRRLLACWSGTPPEEHILIPIHLAGRLVTVIFLNRSEGALNGVDMAQLSRLGLLAGAAFERCILRSKQELG